MSVLTAGAAAEGPARSPLYPELPRRRLTSCNKDVSHQNKSMLTVCLPRLGDFPTLWFLIRHMMRKMGDWHLSRGSLYRPDWFDFVCISSARIDGNDFWSTLPIVAAAADPLRWKMLAFHISISINLGNCPIKTGNYIYFFVDCTWCQQASAAETEDSCFVYPDRVSLNRLKSNLFFFFFEERGTQSISCPWQPFRVLSPHVT